MDTLVVVDMVDIHFATIVEKSGQQCGFASTVRVSPDTGMDMLDVIVYFLSYDRFVSVFINIAAFLSLKCFLVWKLMV